MYINLHTFVPSALDADWWPGPLFGSFISLQIICHQRVDPLNWAARKRTLESRYCNRHSTVQTTAGYVACCPGWSQFETKRIVWIKSRWQHCTSRDSGSQRPCLLVVNVGSKAEEKGLSKSILAVTSVSLTLYIVVVSTPTASALHWNGCPRAHWIIPNEKHENENI